MIGNKLYFQGRDSVLQQTIRKRDTSRLLYEFHDGFCEGHFAGWIIAEKILQAGYYWPTLFKDAHDYCRSCNVCQAYVQKVYCEWPFTSHTTMKTFWKMRNWFNGPIAND